MTTQPSPGKDIPGPGNRPPVAAASPSVDALSLTGHNLYWIEGRPAGDTLVSWHHGKRHEALPQGTHVASTVHEYGGGAYRVHRDGIWFVRAEDQRIWRATQDSLIPLTPTPSRGEHRHGDLEISADGKLLVCVRERHDHTQVINEVIAVPADGSASSQVIAEGADFFSAPRISPSGTQLAWLTWTAPLMPWDGTWLWLADIHPNGRLGPATLIAGDFDESVSQPRWSSDGTLHFLSDRTGWWNLYRYRHDDIEPVILVDAELGPAAWEFGYSTYRFLPDQQIAVTIQEGPHTRLALYRGSSHPLRPLRLPYTTLKPYLAAEDDRLAVIGATPDQSPTVVLINTGTGRIREITAPTRTAPADRVKISPERIRFPTRDHSHAHAILHRPTRSGVSPPPLLVRAHAGPTSNAHLRLDPWVTFFAGHGFAIVDVDYRGSTGYGRAYRNALRHRWGQLDVTDCIDAVAHLAAAGRINPDQVAICGSSAGGYTAIRAIATTDTFITATVRHAVIDPVVWARAAPKFQAHHATLLTRPRPLVAEQPHHATMTGTRPVLLIHGDKDTVTPITEVREFVEALGANAKLVTFRGEGHGLRDPGHVHRALHAELDHLRRHLDL